jgi:translation initiation factor 1
VCADPTHGLRRSYTLSPKLGASSLAAARGALHRAPMTRTKHDAATTPGFGGTLGDLLAARGLAPPPAPPGTPPAPAPAPAAPTDPLAALSGLPRVVLRREKQGRGGKTVTVVEGLPEPLAEAALKPLKSSLGCGAALEGDRVVLQGDQTTRAAAFFEARGVKKVVRGN